MTRHRWTPEAVATLRRLYPDHSTKAVASALGCGDKAVYNKAAGLGLKKSAAYLDSERSGRIQRGRQHPRMVATQFKPGLTPWNKGQRNRATTCPSAACA